jgi:hypothetical protein
MSFDNILLLLLVIALVVVVLGLASAGMYCMNKAVDQGDLP